MSTADKIVTAVLDDDAGTAFDLVFVADENDLEFVVEKVDPSYGPLARMIHAIASALLSAKQERRKRKEAEEKLAQSEEENTQLRAQLRRAESELSRRPPQDDHDHDYGGGGSNGPR